MRFTLSINGAAEVTAESIGARLKTRQRFTQQADVLSLEIPRGLGGGPVAIQPGDRVRVLLDDVPFFSGRMPYSSGVLAAANQSVSLQIRGPWYELERWTRLTRLTPPTSTYVAPSLTQTLADTAFDSSRFKLFANNVGGAVYFVGYSMLLAIYAMEWLTQSDPHFVSGTIPAGIVPPATEWMENANVAQVLQRCMYWMPELCSYFDYSTEVPTLHFTRTIDTGTMPGFAVDHVGTPWGVDYITDVGYESPVTLALGAPPLQSFTPTLRPDMIPSCVQVRTEDGSGGALGISRYPTAVSPNSPDARWIRRTDATPPAGMAQYLYEAMSALQVDGQLVISAGAPYADARPGRVWEITGDDDLTGNADGARVVTQSVTDDLYTGVTTCAVGYPRHLQAGELISITRWCRFISGNGP